MRKPYLNVGVALLLLGSTAMSSCIGSFTLTKKVLAWNSQVGNKFVNELVFFAFWILPVYEVTSLADMLVLNSVEFWSGTNPLTASKKAIDTEQGRYIVECDGKGYTITHEATGTETRLSFDVPTQTWSVEKDGTVIPFMTFLDPSHVKMIGPDGASFTAELSEKGVMAYGSEIISRNNGLPSNNLAFTDVE